MQYLFIQFIVQSYHISHNSCTISHNPTAQTILARHLESKRAQAVVFEAATTSTVDGCITGLVSSPRALPGNSAILRGVNVLLIDLAAIWRRQSQAMSRRPVYSALRSAIFIHAYSSQYVTSYLCDMKMDCKPGKIDILHYLCDMKMACKPK